MRAVNSLFDKLNLTEIDQEGKLSRYLFLTSYFIINVLVGLHAYFRHGNSEKGKALRGEEFLGCPFTSGNTASRASLLSASAGLASRAAPSRRAASNAGMENRRSPSLRPNLLCFRRFGSALAGWVTLPQR